MAVIVGGLFLLYRGLIDFRVPLLIVATAWVALLVLPVPLPTAGGGHRWQWLAGASADVGWAAGVTLVNYEVLAGPLLFTAFFLAGSPSVRPLGRPARSAYAAAIGRHGGRAAAVRVGRPGQLPGRADRRAVRVGRGPVAGHPAAGRAGGLMGRLKQFGRAAISGADRSWSAAVARAVAAAVEPGYAAAMRVRNRLYDLGLKRTHDLGRPAVSVGNLTTGGTGKTPVVAWLARRLLRAPAAGRPCCSAGTGPAAATATRPACSRPTWATPCRSGPTRPASPPPPPCWPSGPATDLFLLDDAFQHRRAARAFDLVLVSAAEPFGYGHVLPRGLLREPMAGLARAHAVLLTRCDAVPADRPACHRAEVRRHNPAAPIYRSRPRPHRACGTRPSGRSGPPTRWPTSRSSPSPASATPTRSTASSAAYGRTYVGHRWFADHHRYTAADVAAVAPPPPAARLVTTDKDWVKLAAVLGPEPVGVAVLRLALRFQADDEAALLRQISAAI